VGTPVVVPVPGTQDSSTTRRDPEPICGHRSTATLRVGDCLSTPSCRHRSLTFWNDAWLDADDCDVITSTTTSRSWSWPNYRTGTWARRRCCQVLRGKLAAGATPLNTSAALCRRPGRRRLGSSRSGRGGLGSYVAECRTNAVTGQRLGLARVTNGSLLTRGKSGHRPRCAWRCHHYGFLGATFFTVWPEWPTSAHL